MKANVRGIIVAVAATVAWSLPVHAQQQPKLVLQITVDQFRGDYLHRFDHLLGEDGFRRLIDDGLWYADAHHRHANTETIVGHTTLATGTDPAVHGMVANVWFDRATNADVYNVQDADYPLIGAAGVDAETEIDPTQRAATTQGRSPRAIRTTTISDEIAMHFGPKAKVFGVSVKDRGAISMAGHAGTAYWFSKGDQRMVTSTYYVDDYPAWVERWQDKGLIDSWANESWTLSRPRSDYLFGDADDQEWETSLGPYGRTFPHPYGAADGELYGTLLTLSPAGDEIVADFAKTLIAEEDLGQDEVPDYLSISFSATDYVGHLFGPSSLEAEDNFARLDRTLADLFAFVDETVGLDQTLIVLAADHGGADAPGFVAQYGVDGGYIDLAALDTQPGIGRIKKRFGVGEALISKFSSPYLYLNRDVIRAEGLVQGEVERAVAAELVLLPGIADAVSAEALREEPLATSPVRDAVLANFDPTRSGDIYVVFEPNWFIGDMDGLQVAVHHGSPWAYDTHVPILIRGPGIGHGRISRRVETVDLAPTIAAYLGTKYPSGTRGRPLVEVFGEGAIAEAEKSDR
ncbi:MAG: alkaline phosphatase family protein [Woeseiaceae bacterium]